MQTQSTPMSGARPKTRVAGEAVLDSQQQAAQRKLRKAEADLTQKLEEMQFTVSKAEGIIKYIYNPLIYAANMHMDYVIKCFGLKKVLFVGMNPGPYGMAQNGVPFGDGDYVRKWMGIQGDLVGPFPTQHPNNPILGLDCMRREESGSRFWEFMMKIFGTMDNFFRHAFVHNYCPMLFLDEIGRYVALDKLALTDRKELELHCDESLLKILEIMQPEIVVAIGRYAEERVKKVLENAGLLAWSIVVVYMLHPSKATRKTLDEWETTVSDKLKDVLPRMKQEEELDVTIGFQELNL